jgi:hypothetical protein
MRNNTVYKVHRRIIAYDDSVISYGLSQARANTSTRLVVC